MDSVFYIRIADGKVVPIALVWPRFALVLPYSGPQGLKLRSWSSWCGYLRLRGSEVHEEYEALSSLGYHEASLSPARFIALLETWPCVPSTLPSTIANLTPSMLDTAEAVPALRRGVTYTGRDCLGQSTSGTQGHHP